MSGQSGKRLKRDSWDREYWGIDQLNRRKIVDLLEFCYGPLFISIGFSVFLTLDPAREAMVVFASEIVLVLTDFGNYLAGVALLAVLIATVFAAAAMSMGQTKEEREHKRLVRQRVLGGMLAVGIIVGVTLVFAVIPPIWQDVINVPARIMLGMFAFFYVPIVLWWATGLIVLAERFDFDDSVFYSVYGREQNSVLPKEGLLAWLLATCGRIPLVVTAYALFTEGFEGLVNWIAGRSKDLPEGWIHLPGDLWGREAVEGTALTLILLALIVISAAVFRWVQPKLNEVAIGGSIRTAPFGLGFVTVFVLISFVFSNSTMTVMAGPIAISSMFVILASIILATLTLVSYRGRRSGRGDFPLILIVVAFSIAASSAGGALGMIVAAVVLTYVFAWRRRDQDRWPSSGLLRVGRFEIRGQDTWLWAGFLLVSWFAILWAGQAFSPLCKTAAGCNIIQGVAVTDGEIPSSHTSARQAFKEWKRKRPTQLDTATFVAAQGGGLFAAYHAAYDLAYRQDRSVDEGEVDTFADGLFAVSGVSGGSFGAAAFWAIRESGVCERWAADRTLFELPKRRDGEDYPGCYTYLVDLILERDYLSMSLSGLLFADFLDTILPYSAVIDEPMDRGHRLTEQYIKAVDTVLRRYGAENVDRLLNTGLRQSWSAAGGAPMLFLNTTDLYTGERIVQSPIDGFLPPAQVEKGEEAPPATQPARVRILGNDGTERDLSVANAAVLSARFPIVSPPGRYRQCTDAACDDGRLKQIADGGYFDNTGLETIADILAAIEPVLGDTRVEVISYSISEGTGEEREAARVTKGTIGAPIGGVIAATTARRALTVDRFCESWVNGSDAGGISASASSAVLDLSDSTYNFTLSWLLATGTFGEIASKVSKYQGSEQALCR